MDNQKTVESIVQPTDHNGDLYNRFDEVGFVIAFENGELTPEEAIAGFQRLIDSGIVWHLQGSYGRTATQLIRQGLCQAATTK